MKESNGNNDLKSFLIVNKSIDDLHDLIGTEYFYYIYYSILKIIKQYFYASKTLQSYNKTLICKHFLGKFYALKSLFY